MKSVHSRSTVPPTFRVICSAVFVALCTAAGPTTRPSIVPIDLRKSVYLLGYDLHITVTSEGRVHSVRKVDTETEIHSGDLTPAQLEELSRLFSNWEKWEPEYPKVPDGGSTSLRYATRTVRGGRLPQELVKVTDRLEAIAASLPKADHE